MVASFARGHMDALCMALGGGGLRLHAFRCDADVI